MPNLSLLSIIIVLLYYLRCPQTDDGVFLVQPTCQSDTHVFHFTFIPPIMSMSIPSNSSTTWLAATLHPQAQIMRSTASVGLDTQIVTQLPTYQFFQIAKTISSHCLSAPTATAFTFLEEI